jgi:hypothetical protein
MVSGGRWSWRSSSRQAYLTPEKAAVLFGVQHPFQKPKPFKDVNVEPWV